MRFAMSTNKTPSTPTRLAIHNVNVDSDAALAAFDDQVIADGNKESSQRTAAKP
jgi:hypothetical protein